MRQRPPGSATHKRMGATLSCDAVQQTVASLTGSIMLRRSTQNCSSGFAPQLGRGGYADDGLSQEVTNKDDF